MARPPHKRGRTSDLGGTLGGLLRSTLAQAGVVREALERGARSGRAVLDEALGDAATDRRRTAALAELGQIVFELVQQGELDLAELPEIHEVVERLERFEGEAAPPSRRASRRPADASMSPPLEEDEPSQAEDEPFLVGGARGEEEETFVGSRRRTIPLPHREPFGREFSARQERQQAVTQRMRATRPPLEVEVEDSPLFDEEGDEASFAQRVAAARDAVDGTVTASSWRPPAPRQESKVWRPQVAPARAEDSEAVDLDRAPTARLRPARATGQPAAETALARSDAPATTRSIDMPLAELHTIEEEAPPASPRQDALTALTERSPFGAGKGGISFDDDLEEYMHPDDLPSKSQA